MTKGLATRCERCKWHKNGLCYYWYDSIPEKGRKITDVISLGSGYHCPDPQKKK